MAYNKNNVGFVIPRGLYNEAESMVKGAGFHSVSELLRHLLHTWIEVAKQDKEEDIK